MSRRVDRAFKRFKEHGDPDALARVFDATADKLFRLAWHLSSDRHAAEDLVQTTFLVAIEDARSHAPDRAVLPWLCGILTNRARMQWRKQQTERSADLADERAAGDPSETAALRELSAAARARLQALPEPYRQACVLHVEHGLAAHEIASALARPDATVRSQLQRGLDMLRRALPAALAAGMRAAAPIPALALVRARVLAHAGQPMAHSVASATGSALATPRWAALARRALAGGVVLACGALTWLALASPQQTSPVDEPLPLDSSEPASAPVALHGDASARPRREPLPPAPVIDPSAMLLVRVRWDTDGAPAAGVAVRFLPTREDSDLHERVALTDGQGVARFDRPLPGHAALRVERGGDDEVVVRASGTTLADVAVPRGVLVRGRVVDDDERPVVGARVWLSCDNGDVTRGEVVATSAGDGSFAIRDVTPGRVLSALADGRAAAALRPVPSVEADAGTIELLLYEKAPGRVFGSVVDERGMPIANAKVLLGVPYGPLPPSGWPPFVSIAHNTRTDDLGRFECAGLRCTEEPILVRACAPGRALTQTRIAIGAATQVTIVLPVEAVVSGTALDRYDEPAWRGVIALDDPQTRPTLRRLPRWARGVTAPWRDGRFELHNLPAGPQALRATDGDDLAVATFDLRAGERVTWNALLREVAIIGEVVDARGEPLAGWRVQAASQSASALDTVTDSRGRFRLGGADAQSYEVTATEPATALEMDGVAARVSGVVPGTVPVRIVVGDGQRASARLGARVVMPYGRYSKLQATLQRLAADGSTERSGQRTRAVGDRLHTKLLRPGRYRVQFTVYELGTLLPEPFELRPDQDLELGTLRFAVPGAFEVELDDTIHSLAWRPDAAEPGDSRLVRVHGGRARIDVAQPGTHWLMTAGESMAAVRIEVAPGVTTRARFVVPACVQRLIRFPDGNQSTTRWRVLTESGDLVGDLGGGLRSIPPDREDTYALAPGRYTIEAIDLRGGAVATRRIVVDDAPEGAPIVLPSPR